MHDILVVTRTCERPLQLLRAIRSVVAATKFFNGKIIHVLADTSQDGYVAKMKDAIIAECKEAKHYDLRIAPCPGIDHVSALNKVIAAQHAKYVHILDDDDWVAPEMYATMHVALIDTECMGVLTNATECREVVTDTDIVPIAPPMRTGCPYPTIIHHARGQCFVPSQFIYAKEVHHVIGYYDPQFQCGEDYDFALRFVEKYQIHYLVHTDLVFRGKDEKGRNLTAIHRETGVDWDGLIKDKYVRAYLETGRGIGGVIASQAVHA